MAGGQRSCVSTAHLSGLVIAVFSRPGEKKASLQGLCENSSLTRLLYCMEGGAMGRFLGYDPEQAYLPPPSVRDVLGAGPYVFFLCEGWWQN